MMNNNNEPRKGRPGLKSLRESVELTQAQLASAVNATEKAVRNWENDRAIPSLDKAVLLAKVLRVSLKRLAYEFGLDVQGIPDDMLIDRQSAEHGDDMPSANQGGD